MSLSYTSLDADVHLFYRPQITSLIIKEALIKISVKYFDFADIFLLNLISKFSKYTSINNHAIKLVNGYQPPYKPIYSLGPVELETLKVYIETNLANGFIKPSKFLVRAFIFFDQKSDKSLQFYVNY